MGRVAGRFARVEPACGPGGWCWACCRTCPRKNCWTIAEWAGEAGPTGMQHLLCRAVWDADAVRDDMREYVVEHLHDDAAVLVVDETGDVKKGTHTVGVQRQYTGTAGRIENSQVAVYLVYAGARGHAAVDRQLYVPRSWTSDRDRCRAAGLGEDTVFATKPELARTIAMLAHAFLAVVRANEHARRPAPADLVPLSCNEIQRLFITLVVQPLHNMAHRLGWSDWRRRDQERSRTSH